MLYMDAENINIYESSWPDSSDRTGLKLKSLKRHTKPLLRNGSMSSLTEIYCTLHIHNSDEVLVLGLRPCH